MLLAFDIPTIYGNLVNVKSIVFLLNQRHGLSGWGSRFPLKRSLYILLNTPPHFAWSESKRVMPISKNF